MMARSRIALSHIAFATTLSLCCTLVLVLTGCALFQTPQPWSLHPESDAIYRYYTNDESALSESAILKIEDPLAMFSHDRYYRRVFSVPAGEHTLDVSFLKYNAYGAPTTSRKPITVTFTAVAGRTYKAFHIDFDDMVGKVNHPDVWYVFILDITDDHALQHILDTSPYPTIRRAIVALVANQAIVERVAKTDPDSRVRNAAAARLKQ